MCKKGILAVVCCFVMFLLSACNRQASEVLTNHSNTVLSGNCIEAFKEGFLALNNGALQYYSNEMDLLDTIEVPGVKIIGIVPLEDNILAMGQQNQFVLLKPNDGMESGVCKELEYLNGAAKYGDTYYFIGKDKVVSSTDLENWETEGVSMKGVCIGIAASDSCCLVVSDKGEIFYLNENGAEWHSLNYNEYYGAKMEIKGVFATKDMIYAYGRDLVSDESIVMDTVGGGVWTVRRLNHFADNTDLPASAVYVNDIVTNGEQLIAACDKGWVATLPQCVECNTISSFGEKDWKHVALNGAYVALIDEEGTVKVIEYNAVRQDTISAKAAYERLQAGAAIVDVRSPKEYNEWHIEGSINIPIDEFNEKITEIFPTRSDEIIFYCSKGIRSAKAVEISKDLGYINVYSLKNIEDWQW